MRGMQEVSNLRNIKSLHSIGARSVPKVQRSIYLEIYILQREKGRLEKEIFGLDKRRSAVAGHLDSVRKRLEKLEKEAGQDKNIKTLKNITTNCGKGSLPVKPFKAISIKY